MGMALATVRGNNIIKNTDGITLRSTYYDTEIYHNNLIDNTNPAKDFGLNIMVNLKDIASVYRFYVQGSKFKGYNSLKLLTILIWIRNTQHHPLGEKAL